MQFRPCIDLHQGRVKQIVGGSLKDAETPRTNFETDRSTAWYAQRYRQDGLRGGHVIKLGPGNREAARAALAAWPRGMQIGGGITDKNAIQWLDWGASAVIVTSWVFHDGYVDYRRLDRLRDLVGKQRLVLDLSCRRKGKDYYIVTDRWQTYTREVISLELLDGLAGYCQEYLIHGVDVEGRCAGIEADLVTLLGGWSGIPVTYAGGIQSIRDIEQIGVLGRGRIDFTVGSALDIFGGSQLTYAELAHRYGPA